MSLLSVKFVLTKRNKNHQIISHLLEIFPDLQRRRVGFKYNHFIITHVFIFHDTMRYQNEFDINIVSVKINYYFSSDDWDFMIYSNYDIISCHR